MEFELTKEIVDQIIFAMEDQTEIWVVESETGVVSAVQGRSERYREPRYVAAPAWKPTDGYLLMERFVAGLRNPIVGEELRLALNAGKGVFRSFKDALRRNPEVERRWYRFKERSMRDVVYEWYNQARELRGLERLSLEPPEVTEDVAELIDTDFVFTTDLGTRAASLQAADHAAFVEARPELDPDTVERQYGKRGSQYPAVGHPDGLHVVAEDHSGQLAGFVWAVRRPTDYTRGESLCILQVWVSPGYRGIGLARSLVRRLLERSCGMGVRSVLVELGGSSMSVSDLFAEQGFEPVMQLLRLDVGAWASGDRKPHPSGS